MIASDAYRFLIPLAAVAILAGITLPWGVGLVCWMLVGFVAWFFRDPRRAIPGDPSAIVSPADGRVIKVEPQEDGTTLVVIFLSIFNVHINRAPVAGRIVSQQYQPGRFHLAWDDRASVDNEQVRFTLGDRPRIRFALIAGLIARRIVLWTQTGQEVQKGDRIGLIRFGSRVDIWLPSDCELAVARGDRVSGGSSVIATWSHV